jgi:sugar phosphate isomerase/epimerase
VSVGRVAKALARAKMTAVGHTAWYLPIASAFPEFRAAALREFERCMKVFRDLGVERMNLSREKFQKLWEMPQDPSH